MLNKTQRDAIVRQIKREVSDTNTKLKKEFAENHTFTEDELEIIKDLETIQQLSIKVCNFLKINPNYEYTSLGEIARSGLKNYIEKVTYSKYTPIKLPDRQLLEDRIILMGNAEAKEIISNLLKEILESVQV